MIQRDARQQVAPGDPSAFETRARDDLCQRDLRAPEVLGLGPGHGLQSRGQNLGPHEGRDGASRFLDAAECCQVSP